MKSTGMNKLTGLGAVSIAALCLVWSGLSNAGGDAPTDFTTMSRASVKIQSFVQTGEGETQRFTLRTDDVINNLLFVAPGTKVPNNLQLVLLNYCREPQWGSALAVWDKDVEDFSDAERACLGTAGPGIFDDDNNIIYQALNPRAVPFNLGRMSMNVRMKLGRVRGNLFEERPEERPECLQRFSTMAMSGDDDSDDGEVLRRSGSIKTHGKVFGVFDGNTVDCDT